MRKLKLFTLFFALAASVGMSYATVDGKLPGAFTINADGDKIVFSKGNLQATTTDLGANWTWDFAPNQWSLIGDAVANNAINGNKKVSANGTVDLFGWSTAATYYGINESWKNDDYAGDFVDWGALMGTEWRTLSRAEFYYIVYSRAQAAYKRGQATVNGVPGYVLLPDAWTLPSGMSFTPNAGNYTTNQYDGADWTAMESAGAVFLPAAGVREGTDIYQVNLYGWYWASTPNETDGGKAYYLWFDKSSQGVTEYNRWKSKSVRLVTEAPIPPYEAAIKLINAIGTVELTAECKAKIDAARAAFNALSDGDKAQVTNIATLTTAEAAFENVMNIWLSGDCDVILWKDTTLTVQKHAGEGNGAMADYNYASRAPWYSGHWYNPQPNDIVIKSVKIEEGVTHLGDYAFAWMSEMKTVTIPSSVTTIPEDAFYWSKAVDDIYLSANPSNLMWIQPNTADVQFKPNKGTNCHVPVDLLPVYPEWLNGINLTFVGDQTPTVPTIEVGKVFNDSDEVYIGPDTTYIQYNCFSAEKYMYAKGTFKILGFVQDEVFGIKFEPKSMTYCFMQFYSNGKTFVSYGTSCCATAKPTKMTVVSGDGTKANPFIIEPDTKGECVQAEWTTLPQAVSEITYDGEPHTLITAGVSTAGIVQYSLDNGASWSADLPQGTDPVTYTVHYRVIGGNSCILGIDYDPNNKVTASIVAPAVENVEAKIAAVPSPVVYTPACEAAIADARSAYDALDDALKPFVENYAVLTAAEATYDNMKYVSAVEAKINEIPSPMTAENTKLSVYQKVQDARAAYDALTADQQALVSNYSRLTDAEDAFAAIGGGGDAPAGALSGKLSIDESSVVYFSKGNLQATTADLGANWTWGFAANQWDLIGDAAANNAISGNGEVSENGTVDLFGWSTSATKYGIHNGTNKNISDYAGDFADWGATMGDGWFTLSKEQWEYLLNTRTGDKAATVNSVADCRYTKATINTDGTAVKGIILFPDGGTFAESEFTEVGSPNTENANYTTTCTTAQWTALQAKGCVFLPAAGRRYGAEVSNEDPKGYYWSSSPKPSTDDAYFVFFYPYNVVPASNDFRCMGLSVRLVTEASASPLAAAQVVKDLIEAIGEVSYPGSKEAIKAAREAVDALGANASLLDEADLQKLTDAETAYAQLLEQAVAAVKDQIDALPDTPLTDATKKLSEYNKVLAAREAYDALSDDEKAAVDNYGKLTAAEAAFAAIDKGGITIYDSGSVALTDLKIGDVLKGGVTLIGEASDKIGTRRVAMNGETKEGVFYNLPFQYMNPLLGENAAISHGPNVFSPIAEDGNAGDAWIVTDKNAQATVWLRGINSAALPSIFADAQAALDKINAIPQPVVLSDECNAAIQAARDAVTALGENASLLDDADIDKLAKAEADFALLIKDATAVADKIAAIGEVTFSADSKEKIVDAREAYEALSDELKPYVSNLDKLTAAEAAYEAARPFAPVTTVPAAVEALQYTGAAQTLITAGAAEHGTVLYSLDGENYSTELPTALLPGAYTIYYKVQATDDYKDVAPVTVIATIAYNYPATYGLFGIPEGWSVKVNDEEVAVVNGAVKNIAANDRFDIMPVKPEDVKLVEVVPYLLDLATVTDSVIYILDGDSITGTANGHITVVIVPDAKVYFKDVNLTNTGSHPAVLCGGNAEIVVVGENTITCTKEGEYGIRAAGAGTTLTISGDKTLLKATIDPNGGTVNQ